MTPTSPGDKPLPQDAFSEVHLLKTAYSLSEAMTLEAALTGYGIPYFCQGKSFSSLGIGTPQDMGGIGFYVPESVAEEAEVLLASFDKAK